ncbi:hypothetical protein DICPUDRAFT_152878 [Dictyostelium purpureum]|uniref:Mediator of RNA polymerase II transcription subunit 7 n=1 Tax=Dictyostelium purpureum TaxID=5786 RepID=F0ZMI2_DICPU|nr:uncharacterized protein DICPUDRAFT_152878 [Dictyostelium purpureum]EGC34873.1 hypothetical protein DICPUDRAFT_152878 [Dictyostelium purpureum]|eukprot:XP_003288627.1 hypothetical protein DICPUDRAFT_152878 [Dictyostelium purpureum]
MQNNVSPPQQQAQQIENVSAFPPPPQFYKLYLNYTKDQFKDRENKEKIDTTTTNNNNNNNNNEEKQQSQDDQQQMNVDDDKDKKKDKKAELNKPLPPPIPPKMGSHYVQFGQNYSTVDMLPSLDESGSKQLYPKGDIEPIAELKKLNRSILFNYLQLLETLIENPTNYQKKIDDISLLFINFHHLLNSYRPHQARETLLSIMNEQIKQKFQSNETIKKSLEICKESIKKSFNHLQVETTNPITPNPNINPQSTDGLAQTSQPQKPQQNQNNDINMGETNWMDQLLDEMLEIN